MWRVVRERVAVKSPVRENRPPGSVRGAPGNRRPYRDPTRQFVVNAVFIPCLFRIFIVDTRV